MNPYSFYRMLLKPENRKLSKAILGVLMTVALLVPYVSAFITGQRAEAGSEQFYRASLNQTEAAITNWEVDEAIHRRINVTNTGIPNSSYGNVYVRVQIREYMEIGTIGRSNEPLMIGLDGKILSYGTEDTAQKAFPKETIVQYTALGETKPKWYVSAENTEASGQYLQLAEDTEPVITGSQREDASTYEIREWGVEDTNTQEISQYVAFGLGTDGKGANVENLYSWDGKPAAKWLVDTTSEGAWAYWGQPLTPNTTTGHLLNTVSLKQKPDGAFYYAVHAKMEAVSGEQIATEWADAPASIRGSLLVTPEDATVAPGESRQFQAEIEGITWGQPVSWSVRNPVDESAMEAGTQINSKGKLTIGASEPVGRELEITAISLDGVVQNSTMVTIGRPAVTGVQLTPSTAIITEPGQAIELSAVVQPSGTNQTVSWEISDSDVAVINQNGVVTGLADGRVTITARSEQDNTQIGTATITVDVPLTGVVISPTSPSPLTSIGQTQDFSAAVSPAGSTQSVTWRSSDSAIATVNASGQVTAVSNGQVIIVATSTKDASKIGTVVVTVNIPLSSVNVMPTSATLTSQGATVALTSTVTPSIMTQGVTWKSSDTNVATVSAAGVVTAVGVGSATITATSIADGTKTGTSSITVSIPISAVGVTPGNVVLTAVNQTASMSAAVLPLGTNQGVTWASSDTSVATVSAAGLVTAKKDGTVTITATSSTTTSVKGTAVVTVNIPVAGVSVSNGGSITSIGGTRTLAASVTPTGTTTGVTWQSSDNSIATVNASGVVTGARTGTVTITATSIKDGSRSGSATVTVSVANSSVTVNILSGSTTLTRVGETVTLGAVVAPTGTDQEVTWTSNNNSVATISNNGVVTAVSAGSATITATTVNGTTRTGTRAVTVNITPTGVGVTPGSRTLTTQGGTVSLSAVVSPLGTSQSVSWSSNNTSVATVNSSGVVTAVKDGSAIISATSSGISGTALIEVDMAITGLTVSPTNLTLTRGTTSTLSRTLTPTGAVVNASTDVTWRSSDPSVASVSTAGVVTGVSNGKATITVESVKDGSRQATSVVHVVGVVNAGNPYSSLFYGQELGAIVTADGYDWRVLRVEDNGTMLIVTNDIVGSTLWRTSATYNTYSGSRIDEAMQAFYSGGTMPSSSQRVGDGLTENMRAIAMRVDIPAEPDSGWSVVNTRAYASVPKLSGNSIGTTATGPTAFALGRYEVDSNHTWFNATNANRLAVDLGGASSTGNTTYSGCWWLRSPHSSATMVGFINASGSTIHFGTWNLRLGLRPALWINP